MATLVDGLHSDGFWGCPNNPPCKHHINLSDGQYHPGQEETVCLDLLSPEEVKELFINTIRAYDNFQEEMLDPD